jgi:hypothetical protein
MSASAILLLVAGGMAGWIYGSHNSDTLIRSLQTTQVENQKALTQLKSQYDGERSTNDTLRDQLKKVRGELDEMFQSTRTIKLTANKAERVSVGGFTVGLATALGSGSVSVNINGRQRNMAPADKENLTFNCLIELQSFDVLSSSATFNTSCSPVKPPDTTPKPPDTTAK